MSQRTIYQSPASTTSMAELLRTVDRTKRVKIVEGQYGPWASEFIAADSPVGRILTAGWEAVPALLNELDDESQSPASRAHTLALLFSITQQVDPRGDREFFTYLPQEKSAIGPFEYIRSGRGVSWHEDGGGIGTEGSYWFGSVESVGDSKFVHDFRLLTGTTDPGREMTVDRDLQAKLVEQWQQLRDRIEVRDPDSDDAGGFGGGGDGFGGGSFFGGGGGFF